MDGQTRAYHTYIMLTYTYPRLPASHPTQAIQPITHKLLLTLRGRPPERREQHPAPQACAWDVGAGLVSVDAKAAVRGCFPSPSSCASTGEVDSPGRPPNHVPTQDPPQRDRSIKDTIGQCLVCATDGMGRAVERIGDKAHNTPRPRRLWFALSTRRLYPRKSVVRRLIIIASSFASPASHTHSRPSQAANTLFLFPLAGWHHKTDPKSFPLPRPTTTRGQASNGSNSRPRRPRQATVGEQQQPGSREQLLLDERPARVGRRMQ